MMSALSQILEILESMSLENKILGPFFSETRCGSAEISNRVWDFFNFRLWGEIFGWGSLVFLQSISVALAIFTRRLD